MVMVVRRHSSGAWAFQTTAAACGCARLVFALRALRADSWAAPRFPDS
jgi:hypothetical protein